MDKEVLANDIQSVKTQETRVIVVMTLTEIDGSIRVSDFISFEFNSRCLLFDLAPVSAVEILV